MAILKVEGLTIEFQMEGRIQPTVTDVSFSLEKGEILALVGESGCGKSVSCMALARLLPEPPARIAAGKVMLRKRDGAVVDVLSLSKRELRKIRGGEIAYIFQEPSVSLNPVFRVGEQIAEAVSLHRPDVADPWAEAVELLRQVGIPEPRDRVSRYPHELSGGMQQRVMIAMAIASRPSVLVADEPTTALDVTIQAQILDLLLELRRQMGMSIILVTHNLGIVSETADNVAVFFPVPPARRIFVADVAAVPVLGKEKGRLSTIPGSVPSPANFPAGCRFSGRCALYAAASEAERKRCRDIVPEFRKVGASHYCACHLLGRGEGDRC